MATRTQPAWMILLALLLGLGIAAPIAPPAMAHDDHHEHHEDDDHDEDERHEDDEEWDEEDEEMWHEYEEFAAHIELYQQLLDLVHGVTDIAASEEKAGVAAVLNVEEYAEEPEDIVNFLEDMLSQTSNKTVLRAIHLKLAEHYGAMDKPEKALEHLAVLIRGGDE